MADKSLNKSELVAKIAAATNQSQATVDSVLNGFFETLADSVGSGTKVSIPGWLAVERTHRAAPHGPQPADRRDHPDRRRQLGQGLRGLEAQGCREVASGASPDALRDSRRVRPRRVRALARRPAVARCSGGGALAAAARSERADGAPALPVLGWFGAPFRPRPRPRRARRRRTRRDGRGAGVRRGRGAVPDPGPGADRALGRPGRQAVREPRRRRHDRRARARGVGAEPQAARVRPRARRRRGIRCRAHRRERRDGRAHLHLVTGEPFDLGDRVRPASSGSSPRRSSSARRGSPRRSSPPP